MLCIYTYIYIYIYQAEPRPQRQGFRFPVKALAIGYRHCLAITTDGTMFSWGEGAQGQLGRAALRYQATPEPLPYPTDVVAIAAGEEHSACISDGAQCFTWGAADGGRLGQGDSLVDGIQMLPKMIELPQNARGYATRLSSVACGSQHCAVITERKRLLTFGVGWFGRLGQGNLDNSYEPKFVDAPGLSAKTVHCAMYHTCVVDQDDVLWVCGRDACLCRPESSGCQLSPEPFEPFLAKPRR